MTRTRVSVACLGVLVLLLSAYGIAVVHRGFSAAGQPSYIETLVARAVRNLSIPRSARGERNPLAPTPGLLAEARARFATQCSGCHGQDGRGPGSMGRNLYPRAPDLRSTSTQQLTDGTLHYIIRNGVRLTGMPAWIGTNIGSDVDIWKLVLFIRGIGPLGPEEKGPLAGVSSLPANHYIGSQACEKCHEQIYQRWKSTPMANVVRDPREHPDAILADPSLNPVKKFSKEEIALVYGSIWKQRYFKKVGNDYFPEPAQWDVLHGMWRPYLVPKGGDWWEPLYPPDNMQRPTGPLCDGCHSVGYNIATRAVAEWNVGCERCHGPGSEHAAKPQRRNILSPARMDNVRANDTCMQCHSQGRPLTNPIEGRYYDWPVGYQVGLNLADYWQLEEYTLGQTSFTHYPDGTAHKNRMQGNDFVQSIMYRRGVTCFDCHDAHGTPSYAQLREPADKICLHCHGPGSPNGPRAATLTGHTHHKEGSTGSQCIACHMPKVATTIADVMVRSHTFRIITPAMTEKYKMPNPCSGCHSDKGLAWAGEQLRHWPEHSPWRADSAN
jgi:predicted CXXCH cytochrome family protein